MQSLSTTLVRRSLASLVLSLSYSTSQASDFNLPFINTSGLGVAYANWATNSADASIAYANPAGLVELPKQQLMLNALEIWGDARFTGSALTPPFPFPAPVSQFGTAKSKIKAFLPSLFYALPLTEKVAFGFGVTTPFGLGTDYGTASIARYAAVNAKVVGLDIGPSLGVKLTDTLSIGIGVDALPLSFTLNNMYGPPISFPSDAELVNKLAGLGFGWHGGIMYQFMPKTKLGLSYNSKVQINTTGISSALLANGAVINTFNQAANPTLPAHAQLTIEQSFTDNWTGMFTGFYTNWRTFSEIILQNTMTPTGTPVTVRIPFNYHNCWDFAFGAAFKATDKWTLRGGIQFMGTPSNNIDRGIVDPIGSATIVTAGLHFKQNEALSYDLGLGHSFFKTMPVQLRNAVTSLNGRTTTQTSVVGGQINWNIG